jgi:UDP-2,3-diacylglucosamine pyrophosphatase LpxH
MLDSQGQVRVQWVSTDRAKEELLDQFWQAAAKHAANFQGIAKPVPTPYIISDEKLNIFPLGDPHIGMLAWGAETGENFDLKIATADLLACVDMLAERAPQARRAALINVGDFAHAQSDDQRTPTGGNKLDVDGRFGKVAQTGFAIMIHLTNRLLERHEIVDVFNARGNHDPLMAQLIAMYLQAWYRNEPRVTVHDAFNPFQYIRFGKNLIGIHHGDGAKPSDLPEIMAADRPQDLGETEFRLWVTGHIHHETCKEFRTCTVESFRTLAAKDFWHHWKGYRSGQSLSALTFHKDYGEISRSTVPLKLARARQAALGKAA